MGSKSDWYQLPEDQCERLTWEEMQAVLRMMTILSDAVHFEKGMNKRLDFIPNGRKRMRLILGQLHSICNDVVGTVPVKQCRRIQNTMKDYVIQLIPKFTISKTNILLDKEQALELVEFARAECRQCVKDCEECKKCKLYELLLAVAPCENYETTMLCPYSRIEVD